MITTREYLASKIREFRKLKGMTTGDLAVLIGRSTSCIESWESGRTQPDADKLIELCVALDVNISDFFDPALKVKGSPVAPIDCSLPVIGRIAAGTPLEAIQVDGKRSWAPPDIVESYPNSFFLEVHGDSMNLKYPSGGKVLVDPNQRTIDNGKAYAVLVNGCDATLKEVYKVGSTIVLHPVSSNPEYMDITIRENDPDAPYFAIVGKVVWYVGAEE